MALTTMDYVYMTALALVGALGIMGNAALLAGIYFRSPSSWKLIPFTDMTISVYLGPCTMISGLFCHVLHSVLYQTVTLTFYLIVVSLCYRLYVIGRRPPSSIVLQILCLLVYLPTFSLLIAAFFTTDPTEDLRAALAFHHPLHDQFEGYVMEGHLDLPPRPATIFMQAFIQWPLFPLYLIVIIVRKKILGKLKSVKMSEKTSRMHRVMVKVLTLQASLPFLFVLSGISLAIVKKEIFTSPLFEYSLIWFISLAPAIAPFITIINVTPFRDLYEMPLTTMDYVYMSVLALVGTLGIMGNVALLAGIYFRSPASWKSYKVLLVNCALVDLVGSATGIISMERLIPFTDMTISVYLGPCTMISGLFCHVLHSVLYQTVTLTFYLIVLSFCYRLYVIGRPPPSSIMLQIVVMLVYLPTFSLLIAAFFTTDPSEQLRAALRIHHPLHDQFESYVMEGHLDLPPNPATIFIQLFILLPLFPLYLIVIVVRKKILAKLKTTDMSEKTSRMHRVMVKVLTLQAALPFLFVLSGTTFFIVKKQLSTSPLFEYSLIWYISLAPAIAPFITITNVTPFRDFLLGRSRNTSISAMNSTSKT